MAWGKQKRKAQRSLGWKFQPAFERPGEIKKTQLFFIKSSKLLSLQHGGDHVNTESVNYQQFLEFGFKLTLLFLFHFLFFRPILFPLLSHFTRFRGHMIFGWQENVPNCHAHMAALIIFPQLCGVPFICLQNTLCFPKSMVCICIAYSSFTAGLNCLFSSFTAALKHHTREPLMGKQLLMRLL